MAEAEDSSFWFSDFIKAVEPQFPQWATYYRNTNQTKAWNKEISHALLANDFR